MADDVTKLIDRMLDRENELSPVGATFKGIHKYDEVWDDPGPEGLAAWLAFIDDTRRELDRAARAGAPGGDDATDLTLARARLANVDIQLRVMDEARRNPLGVPGTVVQGVFIMYVRNYAPLEERLGAIRARLEKVPAYCAQAKTLIERPVALFVALADEVATHGGPFLAQVVPAAAAAAKSKHADALKAAGEKAAAALTDFMAHVKTLPTRPDFAAGREAFDLLLKEHHLLDYNADTLRAFGEEAMAALEAEMAKLAARIKPGASTWDVVREIKKDHPAAHELLDFYRDWMARTRRFVVDKDLCGMPEGEVLEVIPTPEFDRPTIPYAAYMSPAPYEKEQRGFFYVTPVDEAAPADVQRQKLEGHNRVKVPLVALHEGYPGHHLQLCWANRVGRRLRREYGNNTFIEGWALYCEEMMREQGFYGEDRVVFGQKLDTMWRAVRVFVDASLHAGRMTFEEAVRLLMDKVGIERVNAEAEVKRYCYTPTQPMSYLVGKQEIVKLRDRYFQKNPASSLRAFHDRMLSMGSLPVKVVADAVLS